MSCACLGWHLARRPALTFAPASIGATYNTTTLTPISLVMFIVASSDRVKGLVEIVEDKGHSPPSSRNTGKVRQRSIKMTILCSAMNKNRLIYCWRVTLPAE